MTDFRDLLRALAAVEARFVVIGGVALQLQGSSYVTEDLDVAFERTRSNAERIVTALRRFNPRPRGFPTGLPFVFDAQAILASQVFTLDTDAGALDLLGEVLGLGSFRHVEEVAERQTFDGHAILVLSIDGLIAAKRAAGRAKDQPGLIELEALREARALRDE